MAIANVIAATPTHVIMSFLKWKPKGFAATLCACLCFFASAKGYTVTELQAVRYNGQVFLTWKNPQASNLQYNVYRSTSPLTSAASLNGSTYLGFVRDNSAKNIRKSTLYGGNYYFKITSTGAPLTSDRGLYVATCTDNNSYYYAVTVVTLSNNQEDKSVINTGNSLATPIAEAIADPQPVLQYQSVENDGTLRYEYAQWGNNQSSSRYPAFTNAGSYAWNFTVFKAGSSANRSIYMLFKDDDPFSTSGINICTDCNVVKIDDRLPNGVDSYWSGWNDSYNMYSTNNQIPTSGIVKMYTQARLKETLEWVRKNIGADSNKVYMTGVSHNGFGALLTSQMWPGMVTAVYAKNAPILIKALNNNDRKAQWCDNSDNFPSDYLDPNSGDSIPIWKLFNMEHMFNVNKRRGGTYINGVNGKQDVTVGWVQKYYWYDSLNASRQGGAWYWDQRDHSNTNATFTDEEVSPDYERFSLAKAYPAFSNCSINQNPGKGSPNNGDAIGALNGYLDWSDASIFDTNTTFSITCFVKNMYGNGVLLAKQYDSCTTDITLRRLQNFKPVPGQTIYWEVRKSTGTVVQQGNFTYTENPITLTGAKIYRSNSLITFSTVPTCATLYYTDNDNDGFGSSSDPGTAYCSPPAGKVINNFDCNDNNASVNPNGQEICDANDIDEDCNGLADDQDPYATGKTVYFVDADHDDYGASGVSGTAYCNPPAGYAPNHSDCNDANPAINPGAQEICDPNDIDEDCDGQADDADPSTIGKTTYYPDLDHDGYGSSASSGSGFCTAPAWYTMDHSDCNDVNPNINPGVQEICDANNIDENCNGLADNNDQNAVGKITYYVDADHDNFGSSSAQGILYCDPPAWYSTSNTDCNDNNPSIKPTAQEICDPNNIDENCNGLADDADVYALGKSTYYLDADLDGYGDASGNAMQYCDPPANVVSNNNDCNDTLSTAYPRAQEICNMLDDDCDGEIDENLGTYFFADEDNDGYGNANAMVYSCFAPPGYVADNTDCNDANSAMHPGASDICDGIDNNCNYSIDENAITVALTALGSTTGCKGNPITLLASGVNIENYAWYKVDKNKFIDDETGQSLSWTYENTSIQAIASNSFGCSDTSNIITLISKANPTADITVLNGGNLNLCEAPVELSVNGAMNYQRQWFRNNYAVPGATDQNYSVIFGGDYTVMVTNNSGCSKNSSAVTVADKTLYYTDADMDGFGSIADPGILGCADITGKVKDHTDCNDNNAGVHPGAADICDGLDNDCNFLTDENAIQVTLNPMGALSGCKGTEITFAAGGSNINSYQWYKGSNPSPVSGETNSTYSINYDNTSVLVVASNNYYCSDTSDLASLSALPNPSASISSLNLNLCLGLVVLTASGNGGVTWQWYKNDVAIQGATNSLYIALEAGDYEVNVTKTNNGCSKLSSAVGVINSCKTTDSGELSKATLNIFPNPSKGIYHVALTGLADPWIQFNLFDMTGRLLESKKQTIDQEIIQTEVDLSGHPAGIYLLEVLSGDQVMTSHLIHQ